MGVPLSNVRPNIPVMCIDGAGGTPLRLLLAHRSITFLASNNIPPVQWRSMLQLKYPLYVTRSAKRALIAFPIAYIW